MRLFTCKKYDFVVKKKNFRVFLPATSTQTRGGNSGTTLPELSKHLPMDRCLSRVEGFTEDLSYFRRILSSDQILMWVLTEYKFKTYW